MFIIFTGVIIITFIVVVVVIVIVIVVIDTDIVKGELAFKYLENELIVLKENIKGCCCWWWWWFCFFIVLTFYFIFVRLFKIYFLL